MTKSNEPAYPASAGQKLAGINVREHYAGEALSGLLANPALHDEMRRNNLKPEVICAKVADLAVTMADAVIARLEKA